MEETAPPSLHHTDSKTFLSEYPIPTVCRVRESSAMMVLLLLSFLDLGAPSNGSSRLAMSLLGLMRLPGQMRLPDPALLASTTSV